MVISIYCSGSIAKGPADKGRLCWTDDERQAVSRGAAPEEVLFLNPDDPIPDPSNTEAQFGRDMFQVWVATAVVVDARERRGLGVGVEMAAASAMGTPVITVAPRNTLYRQDSLAYRGVEVVNYVHPHVAVLATHIVESFEEAGRAVQQCVLDSAGPELRPVPRWLAAPIDEYRRNMLALDPPMVKAMSTLGFEWSR
jgi:hypothetical protein